MSDALSWSNFDDARLLARSTVLQRQGGYEVGPTLAPGEAPFPLGWEQDPHLDDHDHRWECVLIPPANGRRLEEVVRCSVCLCPRCGHVHDIDPCMERRHHRRCHRLLSGRREHMGNRLTCGCSAPAHPYGGEDDE
jgi:hypothetical protein